MTTYKPGDILGVPFAVFDAQQVKSWHYESTYIVVGVSDSGKTISVLPTMKEYYVQTVQHTYLEHYEIMQVSIGDLTKWRLNDEITAEAFKIAMKYRRESA